KQIIILKIPILWALKEDGRTLTHC
ncbi:MAG: hypothetical protein RL259_1095, partial [Bacteroidota bacterium]